MLLNEKEDDAIQSRNNQIVKQNRGADGVTHLNFVENLDYHFDKKRIEIKKRIMSLQKEKERSTAVPHKPTSTTAYEPITLMQMKNYDADMKRNQEIAERIKSSKICSCGVT